MPWVVIIFVLNSPVNTDSSIKVFLLIKLESQSFKIKSPFSFTMVIYYQTFIYLYSLILLKICNYVNLLYVLVNLPNIKQLLLLDRTGSLYKQKSFLPIW